MKTDKYQSVGRGNASNELQLFRVVVTGTWTTEAEALVWALDADAAGQLAKKGVKIDIEDATGGFSCYSARPEPLDEGVMDRMDDDDLYLIMPNGKVCENSRAGLIDFQAILSPRQLDAIRLAKIERNNGQLSMAEVDPLPSSHCY